MLKRNESFICAGCGIQVSKADKTSRNHCPECFLSMHVDDKLPGDRASICKEAMIPARYMIANGKIKIQFVCVGCAHTHRNKTSSDDAIAQLDKKISYWKQKYPSC